MIEPLTERECAELRLWESGDATRLEILEMVTGYIREHGFSPTLREIADATGISSSSVVAYHLSHMRDAGIITYRDGLSRTIAIVGADNE